MVTGSPRRWPTMAAASTWPRPAGATASQTWRIASTPSVGACALSPARATAPPCAPPFLCCTTYRSTLHHTAEPASRRLTAATDRPGGPVLHRPACPLASSGCRTLHGVHHEPCSNLVGE